MKKIKFLWNDNIPTNKKVNPIFVFAHGAGAFMDSPFMCRVAEGLAHYGITTARFEFPYMIHRRLFNKKYPPDKATILLAHWSVVIDEIISQYGDRPVFIGGKSMGGRFASMIASGCEFTKDPSPSLSEHKAYYKNYKKNIDLIRGCVCFGYPFYPPKKIEKISGRTKHLSSIKMPLLIFQGERDPMGDKNTLEHKLPFLNGKILWLTDGDHDFKPRRSSGITQEDNEKIVIFETAEFIFSAL